MHTRKAANFLKAVDMSANIDAGIDVSQIGRAACTINLFQALHGSVNDVSSQNRFFQVLICSSYL